MYVNNYIGKTNKSDIDADSALNFKNQKNITRTVNTHYTEPLSAEPHMSEDEFA